jgi:hypothetical protein
MALPDHIQKIVDKIIAGEKLSREEELIYFTEVMGYTKEEALREFAKIENKKPGLIID